MQRRPSETKNGSQTLRQSVDSRTENMHPELSWSKKDLPKISARDVKTPLEQGDTATQLTASLKHSVFANTTNVIRNDEVSAHKGSSQRKGSLSNSSSVSRLARSSTINLNGLSDITNKRMTPSQSLAMLQIVTTPKTL